MMHVCHATGFIVYDAGTAPVFCGNEHEKDRVCLKFEGCPHACFMEDVMSSRYVGELCKTLKLGVDKLMTGQSFPSTQSGNKC